MCHHAIVLNLYFYKISEPLFWCLRSNNHSGLILSLHIGQMSFFLTHSFKHSTWNICLQRNSATVLPSPSLNSTRQIEHDSFFSFSVGSLALDWMKALTTGTLLRCLFLSSYPLRRCKQMNKQQSRNKKATKQIGMNLRRISARIAELNSFLFGYPNELNSGVQAKWIPYDVITISAINTKLERRVYVFWLLWLIQSTQNASYTIWTM